MSKGAASANLDKARDRIQRKLNVLEAYVTNGVPSGAYFPKSMNTFRAWKDESLGLEAIGSPNTTSPTSSPHNKDLVDRVIRALEVLRRPSREKPPSHQSKTRQVNLLKAEIADLNDRITKMACDWHMAQQEIDELKMRLRKSPKSQP